MSRPVSIKGLIQVLRGDSLTHSLSLSLSTYTHLHTVPLRPLKTPKNIMVYCSSSQPKNNILNWCVNSKWGQGAHSNMVQCEWVKNKVRYHLFPRLALRWNTSQWLKHVIHICCLFQGNYFFFPFPKFPLTQTSHQLCMSANGCVWVCKRYCSQNPYASLFHFRSKQGAGKTTGLIGSFNYTRQSALYWWLLRASVRVSERACAHTGVSVYELVKLDTRSCATVSGWDLTSFNNEL